MNSDPEILLLSLSYTHVPSCSGQRPFFISQEKPGSVAASVTFLPETRARRRPAARGNTGAASSSSRNFCQLVMKTSGHRVPGTGLPPVTDARSPPQLVLPGPRPPPAAGKTIARGLLSPAELPGVQTRAGGAETRRAPAAGAGELFPPGAVTVCGRSGGSCGVRGINTVIPTGPEINGR